MTKSKIGVYIPDGPAFGIDMVEATQLEESKIAKVQENTS
jgi:hypothetical protein